VRSKGKALSGNETWIIGVYRIPSIARVKGKSRRETFCPGNEARRRSEPVLNAVKDRFPSLLLPSHARGDSNMSRAEFSPGLHLTNRIISIKPFQHSPEPKPAAGSKPPKSPRPRLAARKRRASRMMRQTA